MKFPLILVVAALALGSCGEKPLDYGGYYSRNSVFLNRLVAKIRACGEVHYDDNVDRRVPEKCRNGDADLYQQITSDLKDAGIRDAAYYPPQPQAAGTRAPPDDKVMFVLHSEGLMLGGGSMVTLWHDPAKDYVESGDVPQSDDGRWYLRKQDDLD